LGKELGGKFLCLLELSLAVRRGEAARARAERMLGRDSRKFCTILERDVSRRAAQTRASRLARSLTATVMFFMDGSPCGVELAALSIVER
jgi:hypothetical protein